MCVGCYPNQSGSFCDGVKVIKFGFVSACMLMAAGDKSSDPVKIRCSVSPAAVKK